MIKIETIATCGFCTKCERCAPIVWAIAWSAVGGHRYSFRQNELRLVTTMMFRHAEYRHAMESIRHLRFVEWLLAYLLAARGLDFEIDSSNQIKNGIGAKPMRVEWSIAFDVHAPWKAPKSKVLYNHREALRAVERLMNLPVDATQFAVTHVLVAAESAD